MTTTTTRAEINRRNAMKSTGPRSIEGKQRSRFNVVKHGCRARLPIPPGEDPEAYRHRLDAWIGKFRPGDDVEFYLVQRAVHASWQLDRADRAEVARLVEDLDEEATRRAENVAKLGANLFRTPAECRPSADPDREWLDSEEDTPPALLAVRPGPCPTSRPVGRRPGGHRDGVHQAAGTMGRAGAAPRRGARVAAA